MAALAAPSWVWLVLHHRATAKGCMDRMCLLLCTQIQQWCSRHKSCPEPYLLNNLTHPCSADVLHAGLTVLPLGSSFPGVNGTAYATLLKSSSRTVMFATGGESGLVKVWRSDTATCLYTKQQHQQLQNKQQVGKGLTSKGVSQDISATPGEEITDLTLLPGGKSLMATTGDSRLLFFTPNVEATGQAGLTLTRQLIGNHDEITDLRYVGPPDQPSHLAVSTNSNVVRLFDMDTLSCAVSCEGHRDIVMCLDAAHFPNEGRRHFVLGRASTQQCTLCSSCWKL